MSFLGYFDVIGLAAMYTTTPAHITAKVGSNPSWVGPTGMVTSTTTNMAAAFNSKNPAWRIPNVHKESQKEETGKRSRYKNSLFTYYNIHSCILLRFFHLLFSTIYLYLYISATNVWWIHSIQIVSIIYIFFTIYLYLYISAINV